MGSSGGSGYTFAVQSGSRIIGACKIGPASSKAAERAIIQAPWRVWNIKRLYCDDDCPLPESELMRYAMRAVANERAETIMYCSYADPAAVDERTGLPLTGWVYLAAGFFYAGLTSQPRYAVIDHLGHARSTRQGKITLTKSTLPKQGEIFHGAQITRDWQMAKLPAARVWLSVVSPDIQRNLRGKARAIARRRRTAEWRSAWAALTPKRKLAARKWLAEAEWLTHPELAEPDPTKHWRLVGHTLPGGRPSVRLRTFHASEYDGAEMRQDMAPVWVAYEYQQQLILEDLIAGETTAGKLYLPRLLAQNELEYV